MHCTGKEKEKESKDILDDSSSTSAHFSRIYSVDEERRRTLIEYQESEGSEQSVQHHIYIKGPLGESLRLTYSEDHVDSPYTEGLDESQYSEEESMYTKGLGLSREASEYTREIETDFEGSEYTRGIETEGSEYTRGIETEGSVYTRGIETEGSVYTKITDVYSDESDGSVPTCIEIENVGSSTKRESVAISEEMFTVYDQ